MNAPYVTENGERKVLVDNFEQIEALLSFEKNTFYKFMIIVRNKDGRTPLIAKEAPSGETTIKQWYVNSEEYYKRVKSEMIALADTTRGRLYMCIERKSSYKMFLLLLDKITAIIKEAITCPEATPKRLNKIVNSITSDKLCTDKGCKTWMYDIDSEDEDIKDAVIWYVSELLEVKDYIVMKSKAGFHIITKRTYPILENWSDLVNNKVLEIKGKKGVKLTDEELADIIHIIQDIKVQSNQMCLAYYSEEV